MPVHLDPIELVLLLLVIATGLAFVARRIGIAYPILLVLGGLVLGFVPSLPEVELEPDLVFILFLPPILFGAGFDTPIRDFKANVRPIGLLAVGLVLFTTLAVGAVSQVLIPGIGMAGFVLGAIVAPPDALAATSILRRVGVPGRVVTILEGESLVNDATALTAYRLGIVATLTGTLSFLDAGISFVVVALGGILVGVLAGWLVTAAWRRTGDPTLEIVLSLIAPVTTYILAEQLGVSGVLAAVTAGLIAGRRAARALSPDARLMGRSVWSIVYFLVDSFVFMLIGLQLPIVLRGLADRGAGELIFLGVAISLTVIVARFVWVFPATYLPRRLSASIRERDPSPPVGAIVVIGWAGLRGAVSLAAALALPLTPVAFPERDLVIYLTFCVILATLVGQGLTLPWIAGRFGLMVGRGPEREEARARQAAIEAALDRLDSLAIEYPDHLELVDQLRARYDHEAEHALTEDGELDDADRERVDHQAIRVAVLAAQRDAVIRLRDDGEIGDAALRRVERDLDLEAIRSGV